MSLDYASIMAAGQNLVPDLQEQMFKQEQNRILADQRRANTAINQFTLQQKQQQSVRQAEFQREVSEAVASGDPRRISALMVKYPEFADQIKPGWDAYSKEGKARNMTQLGTAYVRAQNGDYAGAADVLQARYDADVAAGQADEETPQLIKALRSGDPMQQKVALGTIGMYMASSDPDKFADVYGKLNPTDAKTAVQKEYEWRVANFGQAAADEWLATQDEQIVTVVPGGSAFRKSDLVTGGGATAPVPAQPAPSPQPRGGDPVRPDGASIEARARQVVPGVVVTSRKRSPEKNRAVGGAPNSYHLTDQARDFTPPPGMTMAQIHAQLKQALPGFDVINEGDHVHVEPGGSRGGQGGPVKVRTIQEANKLPKGTRYITPDGQEFIR